MSRRERLNKTLTYSLLLLALFLLDSLLLSRVSILGHRLSPIPFIIIALAVLENAHFGVFFGLVVGLILDISSGTVFYWYAITLMLLSFVCGGFLTSFLRRNIISAALCSLIATLLSETAHTLIFLVMYGRANFLDIFTLTIPSVLLSFIAALPAIWLLDMIHRKITFSCRL